MTLVIDPLCHTTRIKISSLKQYIQKKENKYNANSNPPTKSAIESNEIITEKRNDNKIKVTAPKLNHPIVAKLNYPQLLSITDDNWEHEVPWSQEIITMPEPIKNKKIFKTTISLLNTVWKTNFSEVYGFKKMEYVRHWNFIQTK